MSRLLLQTAFQAVSEPCTLFPGLPPLSEPQLLEHAKVDPMPKIIWVVDVVA
jgi:hypothetical protein